MGYYEEKYNTALKKLQGALAPCEDGCKISGLTRDCLENIFPELKEKESEDERIRKELIELISCMHDADPRKKGWIAWLEKQGEKVTNINGEDYGIDALYHAINILEKTLGRATGYQSDDGILEHKAAINAVKELYKKQGEKKPADKVEPKSHEGEWLCENEPNNYARFIQILEIVNVQGKERYRISRDIHNDEDIVEFDFVEKYYHKFDIKDAKDGDVLLEEETGEPFIYNGNRAIYFSGYFLGAYCGIYNGGFNPYGNTHHWGNNSYPATKEQRDILFAKMKEAGYEWDAEKKELKKIEVKTLDADKVIAWLVANICDFEHYVKLFKKDFGLC